ncbi:MAG TPA: hypothetical protein VK698_15140 [Kofleriaceae bacterium]|nr:hypothetical protein [Kofleriaceae bacterium]
MSLRLSGFSSLATLLLVTAVAACGGGGGDDDGDDDGGDGISASCQEATEHSDIEWIEENVFAGGCALSASCHRGDAPDANGLNLEAGMAAAALIGVPSQAQESDGLALVTPGDPENSYLLVILGQFGTDDARIPEATGPMPFNSGLLCQEKRDAIQRWIEGL